MTKVQRAIKRIVHIVMAGCTNPDCRKTFEKGVGYE
jgi:hypothetical protein